MHIGSKLEAGLGKQRAPQQKQSVPDQYSMIFAQSSPGSGVEIGRGRRSDGDAAWKRRRSLDASWTRFGTLGTAVEIPRLIRRLVRRMKAALIFSVKSGMRKWKEQGFIILRCSSWNLMCNLRRTRPCLGDQRTYEWMYEGMNDWSKKRQENAENARSIFFRFPSRCTPVTTGLVSDVGTGLASLM